MGALSLDVPLYSSLSQPVGNVLVCREASVTYREDVALLDAWHEELWDSGLNLHYSSGLASVNEIFSSSLLYFKPIGHLLTNIRVI